jgi:hypothetical protein
VWRLTCFAFWLAGPELRRRAAARDRAGLRARPAGPGRRLSGAGEGPPLRAGRAGLPWTRDVAAIARWTRFGRHFRESASAGVRLRSARAERCCQNLRLAGGGQSDGTGIA